MMESSDVSLLVDMGFPKDRALKALSLTGNKGVEAAMEWLLAHSEELENEVMRESVEGAVVSDQSVAAAAVIPEAAEVPPAGSSSCSSSGTTEPGPSSSRPEDSGGGTALAKSLKCDECGKLFRTSSDVEYHATKSGHSQFSESLEEKKPLSEEERQAQMKLLEDKMKQKRKEREEREKQEQIERELRRIRTGKEISAAKKKLEDEEMKKVLDAKKREKEEERIARQRVRDQIEADKAARRAKAVGNTPVQQPAEAAAPPPLALASPPPQRDYNQTRLQIRLMNGSALTQTFSSKEQLSAVRLFVEMNRTDGSEPFSFMTNFPRKVFLAEDYEKPLDVLGLVPSAVLILIKPQ